MRLYTPTELRNYLTAEMPLIIQSKSVDLQHLSPYTKTLARVMGKNKDWPKPLVLTAYSGCELVLTGNMIKLLIENGYKVYNVRGVLFYRGYKLYEKFVFGETQNRRISDAMGDTVGASLSKLTVNSCYGSTIKSPLKNHSVTVVKNTAELQIKNQNNPYVAHCEQLLKEYCELSKRKCRINYKELLLVGTFILSRSKQRLLEGYLLLKRWIPFSKFCLLYVDTDSMFLGLAEKPDPSIWRMLDELCVNPEDPSWKEEKKKWFVNDSSKKMLDLTRRTPGLLHLENIATEEEGRFVGLNNKVYFMNADEELKMGIRGLQLKNK